jgi:hypothetical protein
MIVKEIWTELDYDQMDWHDSCIHAIIFPIEKFRFILDIDYIFQWRVNPESQLYNFWVAPCELTFQNIYNLSVNIDFKNHIGVEILDISRPSCRETGNGKATMWNYKIECSHGQIEFEATGYIQRIKCRPILSESQVIPRNYDLNEHI